MQPAGQPLTFGARLKWLREKHELTLEKFGERIHFGRSYLSKLESGKSQKTSEQFIHIVCQVFSVRREWLASGEGKPFTFDHLNEQALRGKIASLEPAKLSNQQAIFFDSLVVAGMILKNSPSAMLLSAAVNKINEDRAYNDAMLLEINKILMAEVSARFNFGNPNATLDRPASELGKLAAAAIGGLVQQNQRERTVLTETSDNRKVEGVKTEIQKLLDSVRPLVSAKGMKAKLAADLKVPQSRVSEWLGLKCEPSGEITLRLLEWVRRQERQK